MGTPNLGMTVPIGGTTPGAANNTTAGTYPFIWAANLALIDANCLSIPNNPAKVSNGGIVIDGNLSFGGFALTNASTGGFSSNVNVGGTLTAGALNVPNLTLSGFLSVGGASTFGTNFANTVAIGGAATGTDPNITVAGDATRSLKIVTPLASSSAIGGLEIAPVGGNSILVGNMSSNAACIWYNQTTSTATASNYSVLFQAAQTSLQATTEVSLVINGTNFVILTNSGLTLTSIPLKQQTAATALTLQGNAAATGGTAIILDNASAQTTGDIVHFSTGGTSKFNITANAHLIPLSPSPTAGTLNGGLGTVTGLGVTGSDASCRVNFTTGTATAIAAGGVIMVVTLNAVYSSSATSNALAAFANAPGAGVSEVPLTAVFTSANQVSLYSTTGSWTPSSTTAYSISLITMGAGATF